MFFSFLLCIVVLLLILALRIRKLRAWKDPPPGPYIHPIIGSIPTMAKLDPVPYKAFHSLSEMFGGLVRLCIVKQNLLIVTDFEEMKKCMNNEELDDRMFAETVGMILFDRKSSPKSISFLFKNKPYDMRAQWRELRRFMLKSLRDLGYGKSASEDAVLHEAQLIIDNIKKKIDENDGVVKLGNIFNCAALNVVWNLIAATKFEYDDPNMAKLVDAVNSFMVVGKDVIGKPFGNMPWLRFFPPFRSKMNRLVSDMQIFRVFIGESISERRALKEEDAKCFIDMFLEQSEKAPKGLYTDEQLVHLCMDLFIAGSETTSKSQEYLIALMLHYPDVQTKVHAELDAVANGRTFIDLNDKDSLPYTEATMHEAWRMWPTAPIGPPRHVYKEVQIGNYKVPKNTGVMYNTHTLSMDEKYWGDPHLFRPERLIVDGKFQPNERLLPFGIGRHRCLGENIARMETFLFFSNLMLNFSFKKVNGELPDLGPEAGFTNGPFPYSVHITPRSNQ